ncbi:MAG: hypothetical protein PW843_16120 [Azospirillaceae bacterium]|nr:hypothetical protein [Azospirillaceae bacterium]
MKRRRRPTQPILTLGPLLLARGAQGDRWRVTVVIVTPNAASAAEEPPDLTVAGVGLPVPPRWLGLLPQGNTAWRYDFAVPRGAQDGRADYGFLDLGTPWTFAVPGLAVPPRVALADAGGDGAAPGPSPWSALLSRHRAQPFHMLALSGLVPHGVGPDGAPTGGALAERRALMASVPHLMAWGGPGHGPGHNGPGRALHRLLAMGLGADEPAENAWGRPNDLVQGLTLNRLGLLALDHAATADSLAERLDRLRGCRAVLVLAPAVPVATGWRGRLARLRPGTGAAFETALDNALAHFRQDSGVKVVRLGAVEDRESTRPLPSLTTDGQWLEARLGATGLDLLAQGARPLVLTDTPADTDGTGR